MHAVGLEWYKLRRKRVGLMVILFLLVEIGWAFAATSMSISRRPDQAGWEPLIAMVSSMNGSIPAHPHSDLCLPHLRYGA